MIFDDYVDGTGMTILFPAALIYFWFSTLEKGSRMEPPLSIHMYSTGSVLSGYVGYIPECLFCWLLIECLPIAGQGGLSHGSSVHLFCQLILRACLDGTKSLRMFLPVWVTYSSAIQKGEWRKLFLIRVTFRQMMRLSWIYRLSIIVYTRLYQWRWLLAEYHAEYHDQSCSGHLCKSLQQIMWLLDGIDNPWLSASFCSCFSDS